MTVRKQLAKQVAAFRSGAVPMTQTFRSGLFCGYRLRAGEITLECRCDTLRLSVMRDVLSRVNASEVGGAESGHLLVVGSRSRVESAGGLPAYWLAIRLLYGDRPWNPPGLTPCPYLTADFDAWLAALEPGASSEPPAGQPETWRTRPPLL